MSRTKLSRRQVWRMALQNQLIGQVVSADERWTMLDLGTEFGHSARAVKAEWPKARITGVEVHEPTLAACRADAGEFYAETFLADAVDYLGKAFLDDDCSVHGGGTSSWDVVLAAEIVEHIPKHDGERFLSFVVDAARRLAIVTSPIGFQRQGPIYDNPHQEHVSGWTPEELEALGWKTHAVLPQGFGLFVSYYDKTGRCP